MRRFLPKVASAGSLILLVIIGIAIVSEWVSAKVRHANIAVTMDNCAHAILDMQRDAAARIDALVRCGWSD